MLEHAAGVVFQKVCREADGKARQLDYEVHFQVIFSATLGQAMDVAAARSEAARRRKRQQREAADQQYWGLTRRAMHVALLIFILSEYNLAMAALYAKLARKKRKRDVDTTLMPPEPPIEDWFVDVPWEEISALEDSAVLVAEARKFMAGFDAVEWVATANFKHGAAPSTSDFLAKYAGSGQASEALLLSAAGRDGIGKKMGRYSRLWMQRFRKKWNLDHRHLRPQRQLGAGEVHEKARRMLYWVLCYEVGLWCGKARPLGFRLGFATRQGGSDAVCSVVSRRLSNSALTSDSGLASG